MASGGSITIKINADSSGAIQSITTLKNQADSLGSEFKEAGTKTNSSMETVEASIDEVTAATKSSSYQTSAWGTNTVSQAGSATTALNTTYSAFSKIGALLGTVFGVYQLISFINTSVELASSVEEVQNVVDTAFGDMSYKMEEFADTAIETYGISELTAKSTASTYMAMATSMGIASDEASDMSLVLTGLTGDLASFYNIEQSVADTMAKSVFTGETESLKAIGIVMTETNLNAYAMAQGIETSYSAMSQDEQTMLRYYYLLEQTSLAQGDFEKTSESWANQIRVLSEQWSEMQTLFGEAFINIAYIALPVIESIIGALSTLAEYAILVSEAIYKLFTGKDLEVAMEVSGGASDLSDMTDDYDSLTDSVDSYTDSVEESQKAQSGLDELTVLSDDSSSDSSSSGVDFSGFESSDYGSLISENEEVEESALSTLESLQALADQYGIVAFMVAGVAAAIVIATAATVIWNLVSAANPFGLIVIAIGAVVGALIYFWTTSEEFRAVVEVIWEFLKELFINLFNALVAVVTVVVDFLSKAWSGLLEIFKAFVNSIWGMITSIVDFFTWLSTKVGNIVTGIADFFVWLGNCIGDAVSGIPEFFGNMFESAANLAVSAFDGVVSFFKSIWDGIVDIFGGIADWFKNIFSAAWEGVMAVFSVGGSIFQGITDGISSVFKTVVNGIITGINSVIAVPFNVINGILDGIRSVSIFGFEPFSWVGSLSVPEIPKLATGAVIPPNSEFLAILGDQKSGTNIEAPLDTIVDAFNTALANGNYGNSTGSQEVHVVTVNGKELLSFVIGGINSITKQTGYTPIEVY